MLEGIPLGPNIANMAPAALALLLHSLCLAENCWIIFLKLETKVYSHIWPLLPVEVQLSKY